LSVLGPKFDTRGLDAVPRIDTGGQALGIELENGIGAPFSSDVYIDDVSC
jgi:hypothetical protein